MARQWRMAQTGKSPGDSTDWASAQDVLSSLGPGVWCGAGRQGSRRLTRLGWHVGICQTLNKQVLCYVHRLWVRILRILIKPKVMTLFKQFSKVTTSKCNYSCLEP